MKRSPVTWVPTAYFAMGLPFVVVNMVSVLMLNTLQGNLHLLDSRFLELSSPCNRCNLLLSFLLLQ